MKRPPVFQKYAHSVVDIAVAINGHVSGSGDSMSDAGLADAVEWLNTRVEQHWDPSPACARMTVSAVYYAAAVREMARAAVSMAQRCRDCGGPAEHLVQDAVWVRNRFNNQLVKHPDGRPVPLCALHNRDPVEREA